MQKLPTVILEHVTRQGRHYDWMLTDPHDPQGPLRTARLSCEPAQWHAARRWMMQPIAPHRRAYLHYQGPISHQRGSVRRVDEGWFIPKLWTPHRMVIDLHFSTCAGIVQMSRQSGGRWMAWLMPQPALLEE